MILFHFNKKNFEYLHYADLKRAQLSPSYQIEAAQEEALELVQLENIERLNDIEHDKWIESERRIERLWKIKQLKLEEQAKKREEERRLIQEEFEAEQKRIKQKAFEKRCLIEEEKLRHADLERRIQAYIDGCGEIPPELFEVAETNPGKEPCPFFEKSATCRFGNKCMRNHRKQKISKMLFIPGFFTNIRLDQSKSTEYGNDLTLEFDEKELIKDFKEFFIDAVPEFEKFGCLKHFAVCSNYEPHFRGLVFVEYDTER